MGGEGSVPRAHHTHPIARGCLRPQQLAQWRGTAARAVRRRGGAAARCGVVLRRACSGKLHSSADESTSSRADEKWRSHVVICSE